MQEYIKHIFNESIDLKYKILGDYNIINSIKEVIESILTTYRNNGKVILCGNGGSATDALHIAGELVGRFKLERRSLPAIVLNADIATLSAIANDYGYENIFCRQIESMMLDNDILIGISTSGNSENVYKAIETAKIQGKKTIALLGNDGGKIKNIADISIIIPSNNTARIQECHITIGHIICEIVEKETFK